MPRNIKPPIAIFLVGLQGSGKSRITQLLTTALPLMGISDFVIREHQENPSVCSVVNFAIPYAHAAQLNKAKKRTRRRRR